MVEPHQEGEGCFESNASYFIRLAHDITGRCWWDGSRGWTFLPTSHYILLLGGNRGAVWQNGIWYGSADGANMSSNSSMQKKLHPLILIKSCWMFLEAKQWMWAQWEVGGAFQQWWQWVISTGADWYKHGMQALVHHWQKCTANSAEKQHFVAQNLLYQMKLSCSLNLL